MLLHLMSYSAYVTLSVLLFSFLFLFRFSPLPRLLAMYGMCKRYRYISAYFILFSFLFHVASLSFLSTPSFLFLFFPFSCPLPCLLIMDASSRKYCIIFVLFHSIFFPLHVIGLSFYCSSSSSVLSLSCPPPCLLLMDATSRKYCIIF